VFRGILDNPKLMRKAVGCLIWFSVLEWVAASFLSWVQSVTYVSHLSQLAITISLIPWYQGLRVEGRQEDEDVAEDVKDKLVEKTDVRDEG